MAAQTLRSLSSESLSAHMILARQCAPEASFGPFGFQTLWQWSEHPCGLTCSLVSCLTYYECACLAILEGEVRGVGVRERT